MGSELRLHLLGELEAKRGSVALPFPPSKKTRVLLGYLVLTGRAHRRDRLCDLLWDVADDPRGALRWSLSKLRGVVDTADARLVVTDRQSVSFDTDRVWVDALVVRHALRDGTGALDTDELASLARLFRGEVLEGLDMPDLHELQAWLVAEREQMRGHRLSVLGAIVDRLEREPAQAIPYARSLVQADPLDERARSTLVRLLAAAGHLREAEQHVESGRRLMKELGSRGTGELLETWRTVRAGPRPVGEVETPRDRDEEYVDVPAAAPPASLIGRQREWRRLYGALEQSTAARRGSVVALSGESGVGKTRLLEELAAHARTAGTAVFRGRAYEAETGRPYGPFIDGLRALPAASVSADLAPLLPELGRVDDTVGSRERLFEAVVQIIGRHAEETGSVLLVIDDVQWLDAASAELLHYVARRCRTLPVLVVLGLREGDLADNPAATRVLRGIRREVGIEEVQLGGLSEEAIAELVRQVRPTLDARRVFVATGGNPLFAIEVARSEEQDGVPATVGEAVRDRLERLPPQAADLLRWAAVLGHAFAIERLSSLTSLDDAQLLEALETLERHALVQVSDAGGYRFSHDVVRRSVYDELSDPRRRLMHKTVARTLAELADPDDTLAADVAHHAALGGDSSLGAAACVRAGRRCVRIFAHAEAHALVRRGRYMAETLPTLERTQRQLELMEVSLRAGRPDDLEAAARRAAELAERALELGAMEHARLGFHMLSHLRWEDGDWSGAQRYTLEAERVSRGADERQRALALAEAGRCLAMLERDLGQAEALVLEADALGRRVGVEPGAARAASGMLRLHRGELAEAETLFERARLLARRDGDPELEFQALEHLLLTHLQSGELDRASAVAAELCALGDKLPDGSEGPFSRALAALVRYARGEAQALGELEEHLEQLRVVDAKHRLAFALTRAAAIELEHGDAERARRRAAEALEAALTVDRPSDVAWARLVLVRAADALGDASAMNEHRQALQDGSSPALAADVRQAIRRLVEER